jgi:hypothetical protein
MSSALPDSRGLNLFTADPGPELIFLSVFPIRLGEDSPWIEMFRNARRWVE